MPMRVFKCAAGHRTEALQSVKETPHTICPREECNEPCEIDWTGMTGVSVQWRGGPPTPKFGR